MGLYVYCIKENYPYKSSITGRLFENEWFRLDMDGMITVKGAHDHGYAWDGCSPKWKLKEMYFGTPEAVLNNETRQSRTYYASLIHDIFYQFSSEVKGIIRRREADGEFYSILKRDGFKMARSYFWPFGASGGSGGQA